MKKFFILLILNFLLIKNLSAANISGNSGTAAYPFLKIPVGARVTAMAENFVAAADDVNAIFYNPAGIAKINNIEVSAEHILWLETISKSNLGFVYPHSVIGPVGAGINYVSVPYEKRTQESDESYQKSSVYSAVINLVWARQLKDNLIAGCGLKYITENLDIQSTSGLALDIGGIYRLSEKYTIGLAIQNLGTQFVSQNADPLPALIRAGAATSLLNNKLLLASDLNYGLVDESISIGIGGQYSLGKYFQPRLGYKIMLNNTNLGAISGLRAGFGVNYKKISFDYAISPWSDLGLVHQVTLVIKI